MALAAPTLPPEARRVDRKIRAVFFPVPENRVYAESTHPNNVYESATYLNVYGAFDPVRNSYAFFFPVTARPQLTETLTA